MSRFLIATFLLALGMATVSLALSPADARGVSLPDSQPDVSVPGPRGGSFQTGGSSGAGL